jgi:hypothetical protein
VPVSVVERVAAVAEDFMEAVAVVGTAAVADVTNRSFVMFLVDREI